MATWVSGMALGHLSSKRQESGSESSQGRDELIPPVLADAALSALAFGSYSSAVLSSLRPFCKANNKQSNSKPSEEDGIFHNLGSLNGLFWLERKICLQLLSP